MSGRALSGAQTHVPAGVKRSRECICEKRMFVVFGICFWCGHGVPEAPPEAGRAARLRRLPRDLGAFVREGRRPDPHLDNVVRLERLRERWKVPRLQLVEPDLRECVTCGEPFAPVRESQRFCSEDCARRRPRDLQEAA